MSNPKVLLIGVYLGRRIPYPLRKRPLRLVEPWIQKRFVMNTLYSFLKEAGHDVVVSPIGVSTQHIEETVSLHRKFITKNGDSWHIIGWSTGGVVGYGLKIFEPKNIRKVVTLSTPVWGTTEESLNKRVSSLGLSSNLYETWRRDILKRSQDMQILMSEGDITAPPEKCMIVDSNGHSRAKHHIVEKAFPGTNLKHHTIGKSKRTFALIRDFLEEE